MATRTTRNVNDAIDNIYEELNEGGDGVKMILAKVTQTGTANPVVTIFFNNTTETLLLERGYEGYYYSTSATVFTEATFIPNENTRIININNTAYISFYNDGGYITIICNKVSDNIGGELSTYFENGINLPPIYVL